MTKEEIRLNIKELVKQNKENFNSLSDGICKKIVTSKEYLSAKIILTYMALPDEVDLGGLIMSAFVESKIIAIPKVDLQTQTIQFYYFNEKMGNSYCMQRGAYGIMEPDINKCKLLNIQDLKEKVLIIVPGRAFTKDGKRIGRGKGYYDKYLSLLKTNACNFTSAGVCFPFQIMDDLPVSENDVSMDTMFY